MTETRPLTHAALALPDWRVGRFHFRPFSPSDPPRIAARPDFAEEHRMMGEPLFGPCRPEGPCWTMTDGPGRWARPLGCGGLEPQGQGRFAAWLYCSDLSPRGWAAARRAFRRAVRDVGARRVEATIRPAPEWKTAAERYAEGCGLGYEGRLKGFGPDGADYWLYAGVF